MKILISPYSQKMRNNEENPKNFPHWKEVVNNLKQLNYEIIQIGVFGEEKINEKVDQFLLNLPQDEIEKLIKECDAWISVDNFLPHLCNLINIPGIVIFSKSNPKIFGYPQNINLLKDEKFLRWNQFGTWEEETFDIDSFVTAKTVISSILNFK